jgi:hypothetical protein
MPKVPEAVRTGPLDLRIAVITMTTRYGASCMDLAYAGAAGNWARRDQAERACRRRFAAVQRLTEALMRLGYAAVDRGAA